MPTRVKRMCGQLVGGVSISYPHPPDNSVTIIHQFFCKSILTSKCQGVRDGSHGLGLPSLSARHFLHGGFRQQQRSNSQSSSSRTLPPSILDSCMTRLKYSSHILECFFPGSRQSGDRDQGLPFCSLHSLLLRSQGLRLGWCLL